jgi:hypothetical protein
VDLKFGLVASIAIGLGLYVYYAAWVMPAVVLVLGGYSFLFDRERLRQSWLPLTLALLVVEAIFAFAPLG